MSKLLPHKARQARQMTVCRSSNNSPQECGHWYSPIAVEELIQSACASKQKEIDELQQRFNDMEDDYLRRHKDAVDWYEQTLELAAQVAVMSFQKYELSGVVADIEIGDGFDDICLNTIKRVEGVLRSVAPSEALAQNNAEVAANTRATAIKECAALFSGGVRNRELYVNDVEEMILGLLKE